MEGHHELLSWTQVGHAHRQCMIIPAMSQTHNSSMVLAGSSGHYINDSIVSIGAHLVTPIVKINSITLSPWIPVSHR